jgi:GntR family transcriptional regulator / MocR family aminotransferase
MATFEKLMGPVLTLHLDRRSRDSLQRQIYDQIRAAILNGRFAPGARVLSSRDLAADLKVSRNTVASAYDQLLAEGYLEGRAGSGTYVASALPEDLLRVHPTAGSEPSDSISREKAQLRASRRGQALAATCVRVEREVYLPRAFSTGLAALDEFPRALWARLAARFLRHAPVAMLTYGEAAGYRPLREAIAEYLRAARGVRCTADQVIVTAGSQQALALAASVLLDPGDTAWVEDPVYVSARGALGAASIRDVPIPVDSEGISVEEGMKRAPRARLACVTPSRQYPLGVMMSLARRMALLEWARLRNAWILEDDYDSEFRYAGRPLASLQGLDRAGRVIYTGSFSKVLFPALRLGYLVAPDALVDAFVSARILSDRQRPTMEQCVVAEFMAEGHFGRHIRRMRALYAERQQVLVAAVQKDLAGALEVYPAEAGMHLVAWLPPKANDAQVSEKAAEAGIMVAPLSAYTIQVKLPPGLLLGYAALHPRQIRDGVRKLATVL